MSFSVENHLKSMLQGIDGNSSNSGTTERIVFEKGNTAACGNDSGSDSTSEEEDRDEAPQSSISESSFRKNRAVAPKSAKKKRKVEKEQPKADDPINPMDEKVWYELVVANTGQYYYHSYALNITTWNKPKEVNGIRVVRHPGMATVSSNSDSNPTGAQQATIISSDSSVGGVNPTFTQYYQPTNIQPAKYLDYSATATFNSKNGVFGFSGENTYWDKVYCYFIRRDLLTKFLFLLLQLSSELIKFVLCRLADRMTGQVDS